MIDMYLFFKIARRFYAYHGVSRGVPMDQYQAQTNGKATELEKGGALLPVQAVKGKVDLNMQNKLG